MLEMQHVTKVFNCGSVDEKVALNDLSLTLRDGDFVTVIGGNGAGKSTMQNAICGTWLPDSGHILLDGVDVTSLPEHKRAKYLGRVYQDPMMGTAARLQIEENLALAARRGKRRTLTLLMATLQKPQLLLLDEHTAALDPRTAAKVIELTERIVKENHLTTLMITHNMRDAIQYGNRLVMLHEGRVILDIEGEEKKRLTVPDLLEMFSRASGSEFANDRAILS